MPKEFPSFISFSCDEEEEKVEKIMSEKGKIKNLKSKLEGNRLDLSLSDLSVVPSSKEIVRSKVLS